MKSIALVCATLLMGCVCTQTGARWPESGRLPAPVTNNAVAYVASADGNGALYSFFGLSAGKTRADIVTSAFVCRERTLSCRQLAAPPVDEGRLASSAASVAGQIYIFGGYTIAPSGAERSTPDVFRFDPTTQNYTRMADMPTPVDDATAIAAFDRYIYVVSGWHDTANVALVQVYDTTRNRWFRATDYPGAPVFGHGGGGSGSTLLVGGGVQLDVSSNGRRAFRASGEVWRGDIEGPGAPQTIHWRRAPAPPVGPFYRMAASQGDRDRIVFAGGADNPYNYDGVGYDGVRARASARVLAYSISQDRWSELAAMPASMDHRGLLVGQGGYYIVGGMGQNGKVLDVVTRLSR